jgi:dihydrolipoamide dehydrogenase
MQSKQVDVAIIGAGSAGLSARREVEIRGKSYVLIDGGPLGTTCARVGCMPSKLLIAAAEVAHAAQHSAMFGVHVDGEVRVDGVEVMNRVRSERDRFVGFVVASVEGLPDDNLMQDRARFVGPTTLEVGTTTVNAGTVIIATGSSPWIPPSLDAVRDRVKLNDDVFDWTDLPKSVAVVGTGVIALELGQALHRLGTRVAFFNPFDAVGPTTDPDVSAKVTSVLGDELALHVGHESTFAPHGDDGVAVSWSDEAGEHTQTFDVLLCAAGRRPNLSGLNLEATGVTLDKRGVPVFDEETMQVGDSPIFIAGDVNNDRPLLHEAADEGRIAGVNAALFPELLRHKRRAGLGVAFTDPQIAVVGSAYGSLDQDEIMIGEVSYDDQGRARVMGKNKGLVRVYARRSDAVLVGAEMFGPGVEHTAHLLAWCVQQRMTVSEILRMPFYHPVVEEGIRTAIRRVAARLGVEYAPCASGLDCGPGV